MMFVLKIICLFVGILFSYSNTMNSLNRHEVHSALVMLQITAVTGFITLQWLV